MELTEAQAWKAPAGVTVAVSSRGRPQVGAAHASLHLSAARLEAACQHAGLTTVRVPRPEIYGTDIARRSLADPGSALVHVAVGDFANLRVLKGCPNVAYVAWEYDKISTVPDILNSASAPSLWKAQSWVLGLFDEVWVGAEFVKEAFERHGVSNVHVVPAPVPSPSHDSSPDMRSLLQGVTATPLYIDFSNQHQTEQFLRELATDAAYFHQGARPAPRRVVLTVVNAGDDRKNLSATILGFLQITEKYPDALLLVKLVVPDGTALNEHIFRTLRHRLFGEMSDGILQSQSVIFAGGYWPEERLQQLIAASDFYLSTSRAEGLNLPLLEAMAQGTVVISPIHTAMRDYLTDANCIPCEFNVKEVDCAAATGYPAGRVRAYVATPEHVAAALDRALRTDARHLGQLKANALKAVLGRYDVPGVAGLIRRRVQALTTQKLSAAV